MISDDESLCCPKPSSFVYFGQPIPRFQESVRLNKSLEDKLVGMISATLPFFGTLRA